MDADARSRGHDRRQPPDEGERTLVPSAEAIAAGMRLDLWISRQLPELSRSQVQRMLAGGAIREASGRPLKARQAVAEDMRICVILPAAADTEEAPRAEELPLEVLYQDESIVLINKPAGLVVHPAGSLRSGTLVNALLHRFPALASVGDQWRPGIVHRLDKDTSGVLVIARTEAARRNLQEQFKAGTIQKRYRAIVFGCPARKSGTVSTLIGRSPHNRKRMTSRVAEGRQAISHYEVLEVMGKYALLEVRIETGRTHQIRVHMTHIGHPILGDRQYAPRRQHVLRAADGQPAPVARQMLHAFELGLQHPASGVEMKFNAPLPDDFAQSIILCSHSEN